MTVIELFDSFKKQHPNLDMQGLMALLNADPTLISNTHGIFCGKYAVWIADQYADGSIKAGDTPELKAALTTYDKHKSHLKPIKDVKGLTELIEMVKDLSDDFKPSRCISKGEQGLEKVYEDEEWIVYIPHTFEASRKIGGDTRWCTAASNGQKTFDYYTNKGSLYVNVRKSDGAKFQFHFETNQFMNKDDKEIKIKNLGFNQEIINFYLSINPYFKLLTIYDNVNLSIRFSTELVAVNFNDLWTFAYKDGTPFKNGQWFYSLGAVNDGLSLVCVNYQKKKYNYVNEFGNFLLKINYYKCSDFKYGIASIGIKVHTIVKYAYIDIHGNKICDNIFDSCDAFCTPNMAIVQSGTNRYMIDKCGNRKSDYFDRISWNENFNYGICFNYNEGFNLINEDGNLLFEGNFDSCRAILSNNGYIVQKGHKFNIIDSTGHLVLPQWFDDYWDCEKYLLIETNGKPIIVESQNNFKCFKATPLKKN